MTSAGCEQHPLPQDRPSTPTPAPRTFSADDERAARILALEKFAAAKPSESLDWRPTVGAGMSTLIGGLITLAVALYTLQANARRERERMTHDRDLEREKIAAEHARERELASTEARLGYTDKLLDLRLRQLEEFIAPLRALMKQSEGVTRKLHLQLARDTAQYEWADPAKKIWLKLRIDGVAYDFRLLDRLPALKGGPDAGPLIAEIIRIGEQMTELISKKAGLALSELSAPPQAPSTASGNGGAPTLPDTLGTYLAHFAILKRINADPRTEPYPPGTHELGYYPRELNEQVEREYRQLLQDLRPYFETSSAVLAELKRRAEAATVPKDK